MIFPGVITCYWFIIRERVPFRNGTGSVPFRGTRGTQIGGTDGNGNATSEEPKERGTQIRFRNGNRRNRERKIKKPFRNGNPNSEREPVPIHPWPKQPKIRDHPTSRANWANTYKLLNIRPLLIHVEGTEVLTRKISNISVQYLF